MRHQQHKNKKKVLYLTILVVLAIGITVRSYSTPAVIDKKFAAFQVLNTKCNICHRKQNKKKVFTLDNMETFANKINTQVFIRKRMPKGNKVKLTSQESTTLKNWLYTQNLND